MLPQNLGRLLTILSLSILISHDVICVAWASKQPYTPSDIRFFVRVQRTRVLEALRWLRTNNPLYKNIIINHDLLNTSEDKFLPSGITNCIL